MDQREEMYWKKFLKLQESIDKGLGRIAKACENVVKNEKTEKLFEERSGSDVKML